MAQNGIMEEEEEEEEDSHEAFLKVLCRIVLAWNGLRRCLQDVGRCGVAISPPPLLDSALVLSR